jgi:hypothetical protein
LALRDNLDNGGSTPTAAPKKFVKGDIETRKKMFRKLGSNLLLNNKILTISMGKPFVPLKIIAAEVKTIHKRLEPPETSDKSEDYERLYAQNPVVLRGQDSNLLRKLMGLPGKPFPTLPRVMDPKKMLLHKLIT